MKLKLLISCGILFLFCAACSSMEHIATDDAPNAQVATVAPSLVEIYSTKDIGQKYEILGAVMAASDGPSGEEAYRLLRTEAARLGANAVVDTRIHYVRGFWQIGVSANGMAVRK